MRESGRDRRSTRRGNTRNARRREHRLRPSHPALGRGRIQRQRLGAQQRNLGARYWRRELIREEAGGIEMVPLRHVHPDRLGPANQLNHAEAEYTGKTKSIAARGRRCDTGIRGGLSGIRGLARTRRRLNNRRWGHRRSDREHGTGLDGCGHIQQADDTGDFSRRMNRGGWSSNGCYHRQVRRACSRIDQIRSRGAGGNDGYQETRSNQPHAHSSCRNDSRTPPKP